MKNTRVGWVSMLFVGLAAFFQFSVNLQAQDAGNETTLTGLVSDALCGAHHRMKGMSDSDCTRMCVKTGQGYALVVGDKVYSVSGHSQDFDKYAGQKVTVKGKLSADTVAVESVKPAK